MFTTYKIMCGLMFTSFGTCFASAPLPIDFDKKATISLSEYRAKRNPRFYSIEEYRAWRNGNILLTAQQQELMNQHIQHVNGFSRK